MTKSTERSNPCPVFHVIISFFTSFFPLLLWRVSCLNVEHWRRWRRTGLLAMIRNDLVSIVRSVDFLTVSFYKSNRTIVHATNRLYCDQVLQNFLVFEFVLGMTDVDARLMPCWMCKAQQVHFLWRIAPYKIIYHYYYYYSSHFVHLLFVSVC